MRPGRVLFFLAMSAGAVTTVAAGCHTPTQVTLDIATSTQCKDLHGTALVVGITPTDTENKTYPLPGTSAASYNIVTTDCSGGKIGTLVVTPNDDSMEAAVVVVAAYSSDQIPVHDPASCVAPDFKNCIVARRRFTFIEHAKLTIPILLDPDCVNVPCNAVSTCHQGKCVDSTVTGETPPGELADGGTDPDAVVNAPPDPPQPFPPGAPPPIPPATNPPPNPPPPNDAGDANDVITPPGAPFCSANGTVLCDGTNACPNGQLCCPTSTGTRCAVAGQCNGAPYCCGANAADCNGASCQAVVTSGPASTCGPPPQPACSNGQVVNCAGSDGGACGLNEVCCVNGTTRSCESSTSCTTGSALCCSGGNCASNSCNGVTTNPGTCGTGAGGGTQCFTDGGILCNGTMCTPGNVCCSGAPNHCTAKGACGNTEICCNDTECDTNRVCSPAPTPPATSSCVLQAPLPPDCNGAGGAIRCNGMNECAAGEVCCPPAGGGAPSCVAAAACAQAPLCCNGIASECNTVAPTCGAAGNPQPCAPANPGKSTCNPGLACGTGGTPCNPAGGSYCCQSTPDACNTTCATYVCCSNADCPAAKPNCNLAVIDIVPLGTGGAGTPAHICQ